MNMKVIDSPGAGGGSAQGGLFDRIEVLSITASGEVVFPNGTFMIDYALLPGGAGAHQSTGLPGGNGSGQNIKREYKIDVSGLASAPIIIGAGGATGTNNAGGATVFMGVTAPGATGFAGTTLALTGALLWGSWGRLVGGSARYVDSTIAAERTEIAAGGGISFYTYTLANVQTAGLPNSGGGGGMKNGGGASDAKVGGSGYAEIICYIKGAA